jgi:hypothetical protein
VPLTTERSALRMFKISNFSLGKMNFQRDDDLFFFYAQNVRNERRKRVSFSLSKTLSLEPRVVFAKVFCVVLREKTRNKTW